VVGVVVGVAGVGNDLFWSRTYGMCGARVSSVTDFYCDKCNNHARYNFFAHFALPQ
jgi:hypothetical protein